MTANTTLFLSHPDCEQHVMGPSHPESPARLQAINTAIDAHDWQSSLQREPAPLLAIDDLSTAHPKHYVDAVVERSPAQGTVALDDDTIMNPHSLTAARRAAGAAIHAIDRIMAGDARNAFCAVRPPGHHAESAIAMGFCLFNSVALAAERALASGLKRVAILDFDVHHGNGTVEIFADRPEVLVCSSFQWPFYPGRYDQVDLPNIVLTPLDAGTASADFRLAIERDWEPAIAHFEPEIILVSAGFDAHAADPLGGLNLQDEDYQWLGQQCVDWSARYAKHQLMAILEGGYNLDATARSCTQFVQSMAT